MTRTRCVLLGLLGALACSTGSEPPIDGSFVSLTVSGRVRAADGTQVSSAVLDVVARGPDSCTGSLADGSATSDVTGAFSVTVSNWNVPRDVCVWIAVTPPAGSGLAADTVTVRPARLDVVPSVVAVEVILPALPES